MGGPEGVEKAEKCFRAALEPAERFARLNPKSLTWRTELLRCRLHLNYLRQPKTRDAQAALLEDRLAQLGDFLAAAQELARSDPNSGRWRGEVVNLEFQNCNIRLQLVDLGRDRAQHLNEVRAQLPQLIRVQKELCARNPTEVAARGRLIGLHFMSGTLFLALDDIPASYAAFVRAHRLRLEESERRARRYPTSKRWQSELKEHVAAAQKFLQTALAEYDRRLLRDPSQAEALQGLVQVYETRAEALRLQGETKGAAQARAAATELGQLGKAAPLSRVETLYRVRATPDWREKLAAGYTQLAEQLDEDKAPPPRALRQRARDFLTRELHRPPSEREGKALRRLTEGLTK
jgi:hypothetical protein